MVEGCSPAVSEDRGHTLNINGPEALAISICDVSYKLMNLKIILVLIHCVADMCTSQARLSYLAMSALSMHCWHIPVLAVPHTRTGMRTPLFIRCNIVHEVEI